jgi:hypothetical protein
MPANPAKDLTTLAAVRRLLQTPAAQTEQDPLLQEMITEASVMLQGELGRTFIAETGTTHTARYQGNGWVSLAPYDLRALTAVTFDSDGATPATVTAGNWRLRSSTDDGTYLAVALTDYSCQRARDETVELTGDWGFAEIPADVARGVKITVKTWLREGATFTPAGDVIRFERVGRIPQDVLDGLAHYRPVLVG